MEDIYGFFIMLDFLAPFALVAGIGYLILKNYREKKMQA